MRIAMVGTRGVPARYGGFETAIEEVGRRLVDRGHEVVVYCRGEDRSAAHLGMRRVTLPAVRSSSMETLSHTALSVGHLVTHRTDVALVFNAANSPLLPAIRAARIPVAVNVDGLEWKRTKWGPTGRRYYLANERLAVRWADELITDAVALGDYYRRRYGAHSTFIPYGAPILDDFDTSRLGELDLVAGKYHLVVARMEPENHVDVIVEGYTRSSATLPLVVVGSVPYPSEHERAVHERAASDSRVRMLGGVWDQELLDSLYAGAASYLHGHSVGGTNPSLLRAMGAGAPTIAWDVDFTREVLDGNGRFFSTPDDVAREVVAFETDPEEARVLGRAAQDRASTAYRWDAVTDDYEALCVRLANREVRRPRRADRLRVQRSSALPPA